MQQQSQPSLTEKLFKPLLDYIGLNGAAALTASRQPAKTQSQAKPMNEEQLRAQGWSDKDIAWYRETQKIGKQ